MAEYLKVEGLCKRFGEGDTLVEVLRGISTSLEKGDMCVLLGPSGSGKSTFLDLVGGLEHADAGSIVVDGLDIAKLNDKQLGEYRRKQLGFVFQFYNLVPDLTVRENIEVCEYLSDDPLPIDDLIRSLGLWDQRNKFPRHISGGQQQRCSIGRALVKNPGLLLCDEPTGALDYSTSREILQLLERVNREYGCTTIIVTHNAAIQGMANRVLRLRDGVFEQDTVNRHVISASEITW